MTFQNVNNCIIESNFTLTSVPCVEVLVKITHFIWNYFRISERPTIQITDACKKPSFPTKDSVEESFGLAVKKRVLTGAH